MLNFTTINVTNPRAPNLRAALQLWIDQQTMGKLRLAHDGDIHPDERRRMLGEVRGIVASYGEEIRGELVIKFDRHSKRVSIETHESSDLPRCEHCRVTMDRTPYGFLCPNCSYSYNALPGE